MVRLAHVSCLALLMVAVSCTAPMTLPVDFVVLRDGGDGHRGVTADDARLRLRDLHEVTEGTVDFWADTLANDCVQQRGYELVARGEVKDSNGSDGRLLEFTANVNGERVGVLVAVWVRERLFGGQFLRVVEFAARHDVFAARLPAVKAALASVR
jgi:hypothetical protein